METFGIISFVFGIFGLIAFGKVNDLKKELHVIRIRINDLENHKK